MVRRDNEAFEQHVAHEVGVVFYATAGMTLAVCVAFLWYAHATYAEASLHAARMGVPVMNVPWSTTTTVAGLIFSVFIAALLGGFAALIRARQLDRPDYARFWSVPVRVVDDADDSLIAQEIKRREASSRKHRSR